MPREREREREVCVGGSCGINLTVDFSVIAAYCGQSEQVEIKQQESGKEGKIVDKEE